MLGYLEMLQDDPGIGAVPGLADGPDDAVTAGGKDVGYSALMYKAAFMAGCRGSRCCPG